MILTKCIRQQKRLTTMSTTTNNVYTSSSLINMLPCEPSICVPRIYMNITKERVYDVFADLFGHQAIERVDMIERTNKEGESYKRAFVHFKSWPRTQQSTEVRLKLLNGEEVKIVYDQPWYWRISASRLPRPEEQKRRKDSSSVPQRPFIIIEENDERDATSRRPPQHQQMHRDRRDQREYHDRRDQREYHDRRDQREYHDRRDQREYHDRRDQREYHDRRRDQRSRPYYHHDSSFETPKKPEIAAWVDKGKGQGQAPGAPKGKKPRLVIKEDDDATQTKQVTRPRRLSFDETSDDHHQAPVSSSPSQPTSTTEETTK